MYYRRRRSESIGVVRKSDFLYDTFEKKRCKWVGKNRYLPSDTTLS